MHVAIIGAGISGLTAAYLLSRRHRVTVLEAANYTGGHTNTVNVMVAGRFYNVDTGFIVYNDRTYPHFVRLLDHLHVATQPSDMSFAVHCEATGLEYNGNNLNTMFGQRRNLFRPSFYRMIADILRFNRCAVELLEAELPKTELATGLHVGANSRDESPGAFNRSNALPNGHKPQSANPAAITLGEFLEKHRFGTQFREKYLVPMGAAIWSSVPSKMLDFPAVLFIRFFRNHGLLSINDRPIWRVVTGGSARYVEKLISTLAEPPRLNAPVQSVTRQPNGVEVVCRNGQPDQFDAVVFACHSDQALRILGNNATPLEREILGEFAYQPNEAVLHTDERMLPKRKRCWASWNYFLRADASANTAPAAVTYHMNRLQSIDSDIQFCVTLNDTARIDPSRILYSVEYHHPVFTAGSMRAQVRHAEISGVNNTSFCGAYWGNGFHEDGVNSAIAVGKQLGVSFDDVIPQSKSLTNAASTTPTDTPSTNLMPAVHNTLVSPLQEQRR